MSSMDKNGHDLSEANSTSQVEKPTDQQAQSTQYFQANPEVNNSGTQMHYTLTPVPIHAVSDMILLPSTLPHYQTYQISPQQPSTMNTMPINSKSLADNTIDISQLQICEPEYFVQNPMPPSLIMKRLINANTNNFVDNLNDMSPDSNSIHASSSSLLYKAQTHLIKRHRPILPKPQPTPIRIFEVESSNFSAAGGSQKIIHNDKSQHQDKKDFFVCSHCEKIFESTDESQEHAKIHANTEQTAENSESIAASSKLNVKKNLKSPPHYVCSVDGCEECFHSIIDLNTHRELHGIKLHACTQPSCGKKFAYKYNLYRHEKSHNAGKTYYCHLCNKYYSRSDALQTHVNRVHGNMKLVKPERAEL